MEERNELIKELFELYKLLADKGEVSIGYGFSENYNRLEAKVKNLTIPVVVGQSEQLNRCEHKAKKFITAIAETYCPMCREIL